MLLHRIPAASGRTRLVHPGRKINSAHAVGKSRLLIDWPAHEATATLVHTRLDELDGRHCETLRKAAEHLADKWAAAATLLYRAMVLSVLERGFSKGYNMRRATW